MLAGSPSAIITLGLGSWGSPGLILTLGYGVGEQGETNIGAWSRPIIVRAFTGPLTVGITTTVKIND
jgi:hypothetical protein